MSYIYAYLSILSLKIYISTVLVDKKNIKIVLDWQFDRLN